MKSLALIVLACVLSACSNSGNPYGNGTTNPQNPGLPGAPGAPGAPTTPGQAGEGSDSKTSGPNTALMGNAWCMPYHNQGSEWQYRLNFINPEDYDVRFFAIVNGRRGAEAPEAGQHGNYQLVGNQLTMLDSGGQTNAYTIRIDPADATTGAKKLHFTDAQGGTAAFDPCI